VSLQCKYTCCQSHGFRCLQRCAADGPPWVLGSAFPLLLHLESRKAGSYTVHGHGSRCCYCSYMVRPAEIGHCATTAIAGLQHPGRRRAMPNLFFILCTNGLHALVSCYVFTNRIRKISPSALALAQIIGAMKRRLDAKSYVTVSNVFTNWVHHPLSCTGGRSLLWMLVVTNSMTRDRYR
jgi:hypothetical protein